MLEEVVSGRVVAVVDVGSAEDVTSVAIVIGDLQREIIQLSCDHLATVM